MNTTMQKLTRESLMTLEAYAKARKDFRAKVLAHKKNRGVHLGEHVTLLFEDALTIQYQVQEMLRIEKIFEEQGIQDELDAYNPLIPDGRNFKATMLIEYEDVDERRGALARLRGIEDRVWVGQRAMILKGSHIEAGSIIGAGSIVAGRIPENSLAVGSPAKVTRSGVTWNHKLLKA